MAQVAFIFPGQGSQIVGMGKDLFEADPQVRQLYQKAEEILGFALADVSFNGPEEKLKQTQFTQPALYVHSYAVSTSLKARGIEAQAAAGHSLGEFSALACAETFTFAEGLELVRERSRLMQNVGESNPGRMAAIIGLDAEMVMNVCLEVREQGIVQPANYNSPVQVVISGSVEGVAAAMDLAKARGAKRVMELPVSGAFHSPLMAGAVEAFGQVLNRLTFHMVKIPVYANVTAVPVSNAQEIRMLLHNQLTHPVRWVETIQNMIKNGVTRFIEVGSGKVLSGLVKRIDSSVEIMQCGTIETLDQFTS